jgi:23S rRNA (cytosine1962-C5)-methyltransferase
MPKSPRLAPGSSPRSPSPSASAAEGGSAAGPQTKARSQSRTAAGRLRPEPHARIDLPAAIVSRRAADRVRAGHPWIYASDVLETVRGDQARIAGLLPVTDQRGIPLGTALWSPQSQIALRMVSRDLLLDEQHWLEVLEQRLRAAIALRRTMQSTGDSAACRLVFSEADELPGLIVDRYDRLLLVQLLARGLDQPQVRALLLRVLVEELEPESIVERGDARIAALEGLETPALATLYAKDEAHPLLATEFTLNGLRFAYDAASGQKTGAFLDQRLNYAAAAEHGHGEALDVCTYQGGFALHLARVCRRVTGIDASRAALEVAERNLAANGEQLRAEVDWVEADAFTLLREWSDAGTQYDTIVLDPPAFAKSARAVEGALRGYKELNLRALKMLRPGGVLVTCSCSHHISAAEFTATVAAAAADAGRRVRLLERHGAAPDHPVVLTIPETEYLKCLICAVD